MIEVRDEETIIAQCTPAGSGAIALLRISGKKSFPIAQKLSSLPNNKKIAEQKTHTIHYGSVIDSNKKTIDHVLFLLMHAPQTFTGEDTIEITCHNNPFIVEAIISEAIHNGARLAQRGEFTKRAFLNKKIDLSQAEAINELIHAHTEQALKKSLSQLEGSFSNWLTRIEEDLLQAYALCEASFEFLEDEDISFNKEIKSIIQSTFEKIIELESQYQHQKNIKEGFRIALIGSVNAGKSSLFNTLIKSNRAIVTEVAGTTRDVIEAGLYKNQTYITFVDTAGLRETKEKIEKEGIKRSFEEAQKADLILLLTDSAQPLTSQQEKIYQNLRNEFSSKIISIQSKSDLMKTPLPPKSIALSTYTGNGINEIEECIIKKLNKLLETHQSPYLLNNRQYTLIKHLKQSLTSLVKMTKKPLEPELLSIHLKDCLETLTEMSGKTLSDQSINKIFNQFCIGK
jgi:tRNA modification GTPase